MLHLYNLWSYTFGWKSAVAGWALATLAFLEWFGLDLPSWVLVALVWLAGIGGADKVARYVSFRHHARWRKRRMRILED